MDRFSGGCLCGNVESWRRDSHTGAGRHALGARQPKPGNRHPATAVRWPVSDTRPGVAHEVRIRTACRRPADPTVGVAFVVTRVAGNLATRIRRRAPFISMERRWLS